MDPTTQVPMQAIASGGSVDNAVKKRGREDGDEGDQDEHLGNLLICQCAVKEMFDVTLVPGVAEKLKA